MTTATRQPTTTATYRRSEPNQCRACAGAGHVSVMEREKWGSSKNWCYTGHTVHRNVTCARCNGTGRKTVAA